MWFLGNSLKKACVPFLSVPLPQWWLVVGGRGQVWMTSLSIRRKPCSKDDSTGRWSLALQGLNEGTSQPWTVSSTFLFHKQQIASVLFKPLLFWVFCHIALLTNTGCISHLMRDLAGLPIWAHLVPVQKSNDDSFKSTLFRIWSSPISYKSNYQETNWIFQVLQNVLFRCSWY